MKPFRTLALGARVVAIFAVLICAVGASRAQDTSGPPTHLDAIVVSATRLEEPAFDLPASINSIGSDVIQRGQLQVNLSESLNRVPGLVIQNRQNYAQDLQVSSRGFGARASFGVRGVRLYQDGIPATMPDGQGQTGSFGLTSAQRIEVLRGPFSTLYGNASGGVIQVFTEDGPAKPTITPQFVIGSEATSNTGIKFAGQYGALGDGVHEGLHLGLNYVLAANHFATDGYREHSAARRDLLNAKLKFSLTPDTHITLIANTLDQPEAQDPLGLTRAQWEANPRAVDAVANQFNTRKTLRQAQLGLALEQELGRDMDLHLAAYGGQRQLQQFLALSGAALSSSGGVVDLHRSFGGLGLRLTSRFGSAQAPLTLSVGADVDAQKELRRGYVNNSGNAGDLRRDEDNRVSNTDAYAQAEWAFLPRWRATLGARVSSLKFSSADHYITAFNADDSGQRNYSHTSPVAGLVFHASDAINLYANAGSGFETPTFAEMAYRSSGPGINLGLNASTSRSAEVGIKVLMDGMGGQQRLNLALFETLTTDEIVIDTAVGGRTTYKNSGKTRRKGLEAEWNGSLIKSLNASLNGTVAYTYLLATYESAFATGTPPVTITPGSRLPGVPQASAYAELAWQMPDWYGLNAALEFQYVDKVYVNDRNSDASPAYAVAHARLGLEQKVEALTLREFVRVNNLGNRRYAGSVIVGDGNGRFFEPAPGRNWLAGFSANFIF